MSHVFSLDQENATAEHNERIPKHNNKTEHRVCDDRTCLGKWASRERQRKMLGMILFARLMVILYPD